MPHTPPLSVHYTELLDLPLDEVLGREWAVYKRELPRWLAKGQEGRFVLIKGDEILGLWDTRREALDTGRQRFGMVPIMVRQILEWEPVYRQRYV